MVITHCKLTGKTLNHICPVDHIAAQVWKNRPTTSSKQMILACNRRKIFCSITSFASQRTSNFSNNKWCIINIPHHLDPFVSPLGSYGTCNSTCEQYPGP